MAGKDALGTQFLRKGVAEAYSPIANVSDISGPSRSRESIDVTAHDSPNKYREFIPGLKDGGEVEITLNFDPSDTSHTALDTDFESDDLHDYQIVLLPGTADEHTWAFAAFITALGESYPTDNKMERTATFKISGKPALTPTGV